MKRRDYMGDVMKFSIHWNAPVESHRVVNDKNAHAIISLLVTNHEHHLEEFFLTIDMK
jgi:hypothetical protein